MLYVPRIVLWHLDSICSSHSENRGILSHNNSHPTLGLHYPNKACDLGLPKQLPLPIRRVRRQVHYFTPVVEIHLQKMKMCL